MSLKPIPDNTLYKIPPNWGLMNVIITYVLK